MTTTINVNQYCETFVSMSDASKQEIVKGILFPGNSPTSSKNVNLSFDPDCNQLMIQIKFTNEDGESIGVISTLITTDYLVAGMLQAISTPIVKHMMKEG